MKKLNENPKKKIGILGGTFNPIHLGHLILGESAFSQLGLDKVLFIPSGNPPHKKNVSEADVEDRINMIKLAISDNPHFDISYEEAHRNGFAYTADTLMDLKSRNGDVEYYFILGFDSLFTLDKWYRPDLICSCCSIAAAARDNIPDKEVESRIGYLKEKYDANIHMLTFPEISISSKYIRKKIKDNSSIRYLVPAKVEEYIRQNNVYPNDYLEPVSIL